MHKTLRILNVENSEQDAALIERHLLRAGYTLITERVETSEDMKAAIEKQEWDVILCDYTLPQFSAPAAFALVKEIGIDIPFIDVSGSIGDEFADELMR